MTEQEIFTAAIKLSDDQRAEFVQAACGDDELLRRGVEALLQAHDDSGGLLPRAAERQIDATEPASEPTHRGLVIAGRYKLLEAMGEGGMGTVWLAEQREPVKRQVALKLIKPGMDSRAVLARFDAERQALAILDHAHIAKVYDGGMTAEGRPFFVMELVRGIPLTDYCDQTQRTVRERLELFGEVCAAVQHAHQKGIIHRDLKPSNVLVTEHDGQPVVKVIDFGLAKALHGAHALTDLSLHTAFGAVIGTPLYMAPEQLATSALDVDTRSDLYSLGVILYELLTGTTPIERQRLQEAAWEEICRIVREEEPPRPSLRLSSSDTLPGVAARRHVEPARLTSLVRGELDWIVMKALEKDRNRRYETANGLALDIQRYLRDEPVLACPPSATYRVRKFARRHRPALVAAGVIAGVLLLATAISTFLALDAIAQRRRAERERDIASVARQRSREALDEISSQVIGEWLAVQPELTDTQRAFLKRVVALYEGLAEDNLADVTGQRHLAEGYSRIGHIYGVLGDHQAGTEALQQSLALFRTLVHSSPQDRELRVGYVRALAFCVGMIADLGKGDRDALGDEPWREAERLIRDFPGDRECQVAYATCALDYATLLCYTGGAQRGLEILEQLALSIEDVVRQYPKDPEYSSLLAKLLACQSNVFLKFGRNDEADKVRLRAIEVSDALARDYPTVDEYQYTCATEHLNFAMRLRNTGRLDEASREFERAAALQSELARRGPSVAAYAVRLGQLEINWTRLKFDLGQIAQARQLAEQTVGLWSELVRRHPNEPSYLTGLASARILLARGTHESGHAADSLPIFAEALRENQTVLDHDPRHYWALVDRQHAFSNRAAAFEQLQRYREAADDRRRAIQLWKQLDSNSLAVAPRVVLVKDLALAGEFAEALAESRDLSRDLLAEPDKESLVELADVALLAAGKTEQDSLREEFAKCAVELVQRLASPDSTTNADPEPATMRDKIRQMEQECDLIRRLPAILRGESQPQDTVERLAHARLFDQRGWHATAARLWAEALAAEPALVADSANQHRYDAACAAALAGTGQGLDDPPPDDAAQSKLRSQALDGLQAELGRWSQVLETAANPAQAGLVAGTLAHWQADPDLVGVRGTAIDKLPEAERGAWHTLWTRVDELRLRATGGLSEHEP